MFLKSEFLSSYVQNAMRSRMKWKAIINAIKNNQQQGRQGKSPFKAFLDTNYYSRY